MNDSPKTAAWTCNLTRILKEKSISPADLIRNAKLDKNTIYHIGKRDLHLSTIIMICKYLKITIDELITIN